MITPRRANERGHFDHGWLNTYHTFSFGDYHDPTHSGFRALRVINEDVVAPARGFGMHPHRDMEIVTYVLEGSLRHRDSLGHEGVIRPGEVQRITAGSGILHSEFNPSQDQPVHLLQIWITPQRRGLQPGYEQKTFPRGGLVDGLRPVASPDGREDSILIQQDATMLAGIVGDRRVTHRLDEGRHAWVQVARGELSLNGERLEAGDGAAVSGETSLELASPSSAEVLVFDLA